MIARLIGDSGGVEEMRRARHLDLTVYVEIIPRAERGNDCLKNRYICADARGVGMAWN
jgi:hypothetical protein